MKNYLELLNKVLTTGVRQSNRTGIDTLTLPGEMLKFDCSTHFPAMTTKRLAWNQVKGELLAFLRGTSSLHEFKALGCDIWDANVASPAWQDNENNMKWKEDPKHPDYMGRIYGTQWRSWQALDINGDSFEVDQIQVALDLLRNNPESRRILVNAWNAGELDQACLPPCHVLFQLLPHTHSKVLHMVMYQRSCDLFLGVPFNIASYALLLNLFSRWCGYTPGTLTMFLADTHIYVNHIDQVKLQLSREPLQLPTLNMLQTTDDPQNETVDYLLRYLQPQHLQLNDYQFYPSISAPMAV